MKKLSTLFEIDPNARQERMNNAEESIRKMEEQAHEQGYRLTESYKNSIRQNADDRFQICYDGPIWEPDEETLLRWMSELEMDIKSNE